MPARSPASHYVQAEGGVGEMSVYAKDGKVVMHFGPLVFPMPPDIAVWLSNELLHKATLLGVGQPKGAA